MRSSVSSAKERSAGWRHCPPAEIAKWGLVQLKPRAIPICAIPLRRDRGRFRLIRVAGFQPAPIGEAAAEPRIRQFLVNRNSAEVIAKEMQELKSTATIEYLGEFRRTTDDEGKIAAQVEDVPNAKQLPGKQ